jgi:hypothetical protein
LTEIKVQVIPPCRPETLFQTFLNPNHDNDEMGLPESAHRRAPGDNRPFGAFYLGNDAERMMGTPSQQLMTQERRGTYANLHFIA